MTLPREVGQSLALMGLFTLVNGTVLGAGLLFVRLLG
jgi:hypothetical protein